MRQFMPIFMCAVVMMFSACANLKSGDSNNAHSASCKAACLEQLKTCNATCDDDCEQCVADAKMAASRDYETFIHQQTVQGGLISRDLNSYRDPLQCVKTTCNCRADFHQCLESCTGIIHKRLQSPLTCC
jgi:hypothetical protein